MIDVFIEGWHGSSVLILFLSTSKYRATWFSYHIQWNEKTGRNDFRAIRGNEVGYLYHIRVYNPVLKTWQGGTEDEILIESGYVRILKIENVGVRKVLNQYQPYII